MACCAPRNSSAQTATYSSEAGRLVRGHLVYVSCNKPKVLTSLKSHWGTTKTLTWRSLAQVFLFQNPAGSFNLGEVTVWLQADWTATFLPRSLWAVLLCILFESSGTEMTSFHFLLRTQSFSTFLLCSSRPSWKSGSQSTADVILHQIATPVSRATRHTLGKMLVPGTAQCP